MENLIQDELTGKIIGAAIEVHRELGPGLLETIYRKALCHEFTLQNIPFEQEYKVDVQYKGTVIHGQQIDIVVAREVVVEVKSLVKLPEIAVSQVVSYLKATGLKRGLLINFGEKTLVDGVKRINNFY